MMAKRIGFILAGLTLVVLFYIRTAGELSYTPAFSEDRALLTGITRQAAKPVERHPTRLGSLTELPLDRDEVRMEEEEDQELADSLSARKATELDLPPQDVDLGLEQDQFPEGGELTAETVNLLNGNALETRLDLRFPSANRMGLSFEALYNSRSNQRGILGFGWSHTYSAMLIPPAETGQALKIIDETGKARYFAETSAGKFEGLYQEKTRVIRSTDLRYHCYRLDGSELVFSDMGALTSIEDPVGNRITLSYSQGRLQKVSDLSTRRTLTFQYNEKGFIESITGPRTDAVSDGIWVHFGYEKGNLTCVTYADGSGFVYEYNDPQDIHNLTAKRDKLRHLINGWGYDATDRCTSNFSRYGKGADLIEYVSETEVEVSDSYGTVRTYSIGAFGGRRRVTAVSLPNAPYRADNLIGWAYDEAMRLTQVQHGGGRVDLFEEFESRGYPKRVRLASGTDKERVITFTYHPKRNALLARSEKSLFSEESSPREKVTIWDYDDPASGDPAIPNENPTRLPYRLIEKGYTKSLRGEIVPYTYTTSFSHNERGQILAVDGPRAVKGDTISFTYDPKTSNLLSVTQPLSGKQTGTTLFLEQDNAGYPKIIKDMNAHVTELAYDGRARAISTTYTKDLTGDTVKSLLVFHPAGDLKSSTDEDGVKQSYDYDPAQGRIKRIREDLRGDQDDYIELSYDDAGNVIKREYFDGATGELTREKSWSHRHPTYPGLLWREIEPAVADRPEAITEYEYYPSGMIWKKTVPFGADPNGVTTVFEYDPFNRLEHVTDPATADHGPVETRFFYDSHGNLKELRAQDGTEEKINRYTYNDMGWLIDETTPDTGTSRYGYNEAGALGWKIDAMDVRIDYTYDNADRLIKVRSDPVGELPEYSITYTYDRGKDGRGHLSRMEDMSGATNLSYDARGRLFRKTSTIALDPSTRHDFTMSRKFTDGGRVEQITYPSAGSPQSRKILNLERSAECTCSVDRIDVREDPHTPGQLLFSSPSYRPFGEASGMQIGSKGEVSNRFNTRGEMTAANPGQPMQRSYSYYQDGRLKSILAPNTPWFSRTYTYDQLGRIKQATGPFGAIDYTYSPLGNRTSEKENDLTTVYGYSLGTNRLESITTEGEPPVVYVHDLCGRMISTGRLAFAYNQQGMLIGVEKSGEVKGEYAYNALGQRVKKTRGSSTTLYLYDFDGNLVAEADGTGRIFSEYFYRGRVRLARLNPGTGAFHFFHNDQLGTPELMTDTSNTVVWEALYKPFGEVSVHPKSTVTNNFRFQGQYYDVESGLHHNHFRYFDPNIGKYVTPDPIGLAGGINPYVYVENDPLNRVDRYGLWGEDVHSGTGNPQYGTYTWAQQAGFSDLDATLLAIGNQAVDDIAWTGWYPPLIGIGNQSRHFNLWNCEKSGHTDSRAFWADYELDRAIESFGDNYNAALGHLAKGLHSIQDTFAHRNWNPGLAGISPHPSWYDDWDDERNSVASILTELATRQYLNSFLKATHR